MVKREDRYATGTRTHRRDSIGIRVRYAVAILTALIAAFSATRAYTTANQLKHDERRTCLIQDRELPAGHELAASMRDIHALLTIPPSPDAPPTPPNIKRIVANLNNHLALYLEAESRQPTQRNC